MKIVLQPMPEVDEGIPVGTLDGRPLIYVGRTAHVDGQPLQHGEIAEAMVDAVDHAAAKILGGEWSKPLALVTGLNQRTCNRDRIRQWGLPPWVLQLLAHNATHPHARALGDIMMGVARIYALKGPLLSREENLKRVHGIEDPVAYSKSLAGLACNIVSWASKERGKAASARGAVTFD